jgi:hypothetical protein
LLFPQPPHEHLSREVFATLLKYMQTFLLGLPSPKVIANPFVSLVISLFLHPSKLTVPFYFSALWSLPSAFVWPSSPLLPPPLQNINCPLILHSTPFEYIMESLVHDIVLCTYIFHMIFVYI